MAIYFTDFESTAVGNTPTDWTLNRWSANCSLLVASDAGAVNGKTAVFKNTGGGDSRAIFTWDAVDTDANRDNLEILVRFKGNSLSVTENTARLFGRGSGPNDDPIGYVLGLAGLHSNARKRIIKYFNQSFSDLLSETWAGVAQNEWWLVRAQYTGTTLRFRAWLDGTTEPTTWDLSTTDSDIASAGWVGLFIFDAGYETHVDWFSVGTNGDAAPAGSFINAGITITGIKEANEANTLVASVDSPRIKVWSGTDDSGAEDDLLGEGETNYPITNGILEVPLSTYFVDDVVTVEVMWTVGTERKLFIKETTVVDLEAGT